MIKWFTKFRNNKKNQGFSLVELVIVIAIMAVLIGVITPLFIRYVEKSKEARDLQSINAYKEAVEIISANKEYPVNIQISISGTTGAISNMSLSDISEVGLEPTFKLDSKHWKPFTWEYDLVSHSWTLKGADLSGAKYYTAAGETK